MFHEVDFLTEKHPDVFGSAGAYAQAYCFFVAALGAATVVGPLLRKAGLASHSSFNGTALCER